MNIVYKVMASVVKNKLNEGVERELGQYQCGFRKYRSTIDQILTLKQVVNNGIEQNLTLLAIFIDSKQTYDTVIREKVFKAMSDMGINGNLIRMVKMTLITDTDYIVLVNGYTTSKNFKVIRGLRQGDPLSTMFFNIMLEKAVRESGIQPKV